MPRYRLARSGDRLPMPDRGGAFFTSSVTGEVIDPYDPYYARLIGSGDIILVPDPAVPVIPVPPLTGTDVVGIMRDGVVLPKTLDELVVFLGGSSGPTLSLSATSFLTGTPINTALAAIGAPTGWVVSAETTFGGRVGVVGRNLVASTALSAAATGTVRLKAATTDGRQSITNTFDLVVAGAGSAPTISGTLPAATIGVAYSSVPTISGGVAPYIVTVAGLTSTGLSLSDTGTGAIGGTPTGPAGTLSLTYTVVDSIGATSGPTAFSLQVNAAVVAVPVNTALPSFTGIMSVGQVLTGNDGAWSGGPTSFNRSWRRNGTAIAGTNALSYTQVTADEGAIITFASAATNASGASTVQASTGRKCLAKVIQGLGQGMSPVIAGFGGASKRSCVYRRPVYSESRIYAIRPIISVSNPVSSGGVVNDTLFSGNQAVLTGQVTMLPTAPSALTGIAPRTLFTFGGADHWTFDASTFSTGADDENAYIVGDWLELGQASIAPKQVMDIWSSVALPATNATASLPINQTPSNFVQRYAGYQEFTTDCVADGVALSATSISGVTTLQTNGANAGFMPVFFEIKTDAGTEMILFLSADSLIEGVGEGIYGSTAADGTIHGDAMGSARGNKGYAARGCETLAANFVNLGRGSDGNKNLAVASRWRHRRGLAKRLAATATAIFNESGHNDIAAVPSIASRGNSAALTLDTPYSASGNIYLCTLAGTSAATAPTGTDPAADFLDGTARLLYLGPNSGGSIVGFASLAQMVAVNRQIRSALPGIAVLQALITPDSQANKTPSAISQSGTTVTVGVPSGGSTDGIVVGGVVAMTGQAPSGYRGNVTVTGKTSTTFTYEAAASLGAVTTLGLYSDMLASSEQQVLAAGWGGPTSARGVLNAAIRAKHPSLQLAAVIDPNVGSERTYPPTETGYWANNGQPGAYAADGTHPTSQGHARIAPRFAADFAAWRATAPLAA